jgi:cell division protein FtsB
VTAIVPARGERPAPSHLQPGSVPARRPEHRRSQHLRPVERPRPKRSPLVPALVGVGIVVTALLGLAVMHALLIGGQVRLDAMRDDVASETEAIRRLELRVAELESPDRVLDAARDRLGMVQPTEVGYLLPVSVEDPAAEPVRVEAATEPEPEPVVAEGDDAAGDEPTDDAATDVDPSEGGREE